MQGFLWINKERPNQVFTVRCAFFGYTFGSTPSIGALRPFSVQFESYMKTCGLIRFNLSENVLRRFVLYVRHYETNETLLISVIVITFSEFQITSAKEGSDKKPNRGLFFVTSLSMI